MEIILSETFCLNVVFSLWFIVEIMFPHQLVATVFLLLFYSFLLLLFFVKRDRKKRDKFRFLFIVGYFGYAIFGILNIVLGWSIDSNKSLSMCFTLIRNVVFMLLFMFLLSRQSPERFLHFFSKVLLMVCVVSFLIGLPQFVSRTRLQVLSSETNVLANVMAYYSVILFYFIFVLHERKIRHYISLILCVLVIFMTGTRSALVISFIGFFILFCFSKPKLFFVRFFLIVFSVLFIYLLLTKVEILYDVIGNRVEAAFEFLSKGTTNEQSITSRSDYISLAFDGFIDSPWYGNGLNTFSSLQLSYGTYSHSNYLETLFSLGIIGFVLYYSPFIILLLSMMKKRNLKNNLLISAIIIPFLICEYFSITYLNRIFLVIICFCYYVSTCPIRNKKTVSYQPRLAENRFHTVVN